MSGEFSTLFADEPDLTDGEAFFTDNRVVVQIAAAFEDNLDPLDTPYLEWVDVTEQVIAADWTEGSQTGAESRWPVGRLELDCYDLVDEIADFISDDPATRLAAGSLIRVGMIDTDAEVWWPQFSGVIDKIGEPAQPGPRTWRITAFDVAYSLAGNTLRGTGSTIPANTDTLSALIEDLLDDLGVRYDWDIAATAAENAEYVIAGNMLALVNRLADSYGHRFIAGRDGVLRTVPWDDVANAIATTILDELDTGNPNAVYGRPTWSTSNARVASILSIDSPDAALAANHDATVSSLLFAKNGPRQDAPGWPKLDLMYEVLAEGVDLATDAALRFGDELTLERIDIDTLQNRHSDDVLPLLRAWGAGDGVRMLRSYGEALDKSLLILGATKRITRLHEYPRFTCTYYPKILGDYAP